MGNAAQKILNVTVGAVPESHYPIHIGAGFLTSLWTTIETQWPTHKPFLVTDANVVKAGWVKQLLAERTAATYIIDPPGEGSKYIQTITAILEQMEQAFLGRDSIVVALGGGTVGDIAGFAAAIYKRGVPVIQIPTTTVAQADSSVGGKTGIDSTQSKNAFGCFWQPAAVFIDVKTLATLDDRQYRAGLVESVKHAAIADAKYFEYLETHIEAILSRDIRVLEHIAFENCRIKADVVAEDPTEKNKRRILNYGHTLGHAVESASRFELLHGEAVAVGMIAAGLLEKEMGLVADDRLARIGRLLEKLGQPTRIPATLPADTLLDLLKRDKKAVDQWPRFVLLEKLGQALCKDGQWAHQVAPAAVGKVIDQLS